MLRLPVSDVLVRWRPARGLHDTVLAESGPGLAGALACAEGCVEDAAGRTVDPAALPVGDLDLLIVQRRRELRSDWFVAEGRCGACGAAVDVRFGLAAYLEHCRPRRPRGVSPAEPGWWRHDRLRLTFRVPSVADVLASAGAGRPRADLLRRLVREPVTAGQAGILERAMAALAPTLRTEVAGTCPECGQQVRLDVDARELCLAELRFLAGSVHDDVHLIAATYGWSEQAILDLPSRRRRRYADLIAGRTEMVSLEAVAGG
ncbi:hypothetical protein [Actinoplanes sp. NPDC026619]|uniref:hypothetical protein n=1 Tax=Actinoplanes sp. NPDC026619 TaxID=3155798 RepID=UPI0033C50E35